MRKNSPTRPAHGTPAGSTASAPTAAPPAARPAAPDRSDAVRAGTPAAPATARPFSPAPAVPATSTPAPGWPAPPWIGATADLINQWIRPAHAANDPAPAATPWTPAPPREEIDPPTSGDRLLHAMMGRLSLGISPAALGLAYADWACHLALSPGKWQLLANKAARKAVKLGAYAARSLAQPDAPPCIEPLPQDQRFRSEAWKRWPFNLVSQGFLLQQQWWHNATTGIGGVSRHHEQVASFVARQLLDIASPVNSVATNPEVLETTLREGGQNLVRGAINWLNDWERSAGGKPPAGAEAYRPGVQVAVTPGKVVYRNRLIELIQYTPQTPKVNAEPLLIVPAWIMKYYILDLSPANSMVNYLVSQGHTVFMISWHNPGVDDRDLGMDDYMRLGVLDALKAIRAIVPDRKVNAAGYCLGGTLLTITAAYLAREGDDILNSITLLAAQTDFSEAGELTLFIDDSQLNYLEDIMWEQGYLDTKQMASAFRLLRSNDMIWSRITHEYLMGRRPPMTDLMAWNADETRMPYRMHSEYLRRMFLDNDLFEGRYKVDGRAIAMSDIAAPVFAVSTESDHVAPWRSVHKINLISELEVTFLLTNGGHNAGILSEPGHPGRRYRIRFRPAGAKYNDPDGWYEVTPPVEGSWWPAWSEWLTRHASAQAAPPATGAPEQGFPILGNAPGHYVHET